jgi:hypothetical protein
MLGYLNHVHAIQGWLHPFVTVVKGKVKLSLCLINWALCHEDIPSERKMWHAKISFIAWNDRVDEARQIRDSPDYYSNVFWTNSGLRFPKFLLIIAIMWPQNRYTFSSFLLLCLTFPLYVGCLAARSPSLSSESSSISILSHVVPSFCVTSFLTCCCQLDLNLPVGYFSFSFMLESFFAILSCFILEM